MTQETMLWLAAAVAVGLIGYLLWVYMKQGREAALEQARRIALELMLRAEKKFGTDNGAVKMDWVTTQLHARLPVQLRLVLKPEMIGEFLEEVYRQFKDRID